MKTFNLTEILKIVPFDAVFREEISQTLVYGTVDEKYEAEKACWDAFWEMYKVLTELKYKELATSLMKGDTTLKLAELTRKARQAVWKDFEDMLTGKKQDVEQIDEIRAKLQQLIQKDSLKS